MKCPGAIFHQPSNINVRMPHALASGLIATYSIIFYHYDKHELLVYHFIKRLQKVIL